MRVTSVGRVLSDARFRGGGGRRGRGRCLERVRHIIIVSVGESPARRRELHEAGIDKLLFKPGVLTVATDTPVYTPWFVANNPKNGQGLRKRGRLRGRRPAGLRQAQVVWVHEPFNSVYSPGPKAFDFDINEVSYTPQRAQAVTFSNSYYPVQQAIVAMKGTADRDQALAFGAQDVPVRRPDRHHRARPTSTPTSSRLSAEGVQHPRAGGLLA